LAAAGSLHENGLRGPASQRYPSVDLASAYALIAYALRNRDSVDTYLVERARAGAQMQAEIEVRFPPDGLRARLLARRAAGQ
jgi:tRNA C32,U32 (ribose-2'-O)-methylase TrmJ